MSAVAPPACESTVSTAANATSDVTVCTPVSVTMTKPDEPAGWYTMVVAAVCDAAMHLDGTNLAVAFQRPEGTTDTGCVVRPFPAASADEQPMAISSFEDLLQATAQQPEPQRILFVFVQKGPPDDWSADKAASFRRGSGGTLTPVLCVDKAVSEIGSFAELARESEATRQHWDIALVACLAGSNGVAPSASEVDQGLATMVDAVKTGSKLWRFLAFDHRGDPLQITA